LAVCQSTWPAKTALLVRPGVAEKAYHLVALAGNRGVRGARHDAKLDDRCIHLDSGDSEANGLGAARWRRLGAGKGRYAAVAGVATYDILDGALAGQLDRVGGQG